MLLKSKSIATRLLLLSALSAVLVIVSILAFIKLSVLPRMTDRALENQTTAVASALKGIYSNGNLWTDQALSRPDVLTTLDAFSNEGNASATLFVLKDGEYRRMATSLKKEDGSRAIGTRLEPTSPAAIALQKGQTYLGPNMLFGRLHMTTYIPVAFSNGIKGSVYVGIAYDSADPTLVLAKQLDYMVYIVGAVSLLLLGTGLYFSIRVERTHRETEDIMRTTQEGLFLLDTDLRMGTQTSQALGKILGFEVKAGDHFLERLKPSVSPKVFDTAQEYIDLLLRHDVKEKLVASLNPLDCIEVSAMQGAGKMESRFLQIRFNRVMKGTKITHLLVTANDISRQVKLERELRESERRVQDQMSMMVHILQADPITLQDFLSNANQTLNTINEELRTSNPKTGITQQELDGILRCAHQLKGDASSMQLEAVTQSLHALENDAQNLRSQTDRSGENLLPLAVRIKSLYSEIASIQEVIGRIGQIRGMVSVEPSKPERSADCDMQHALVRQWQHFSQQLAQRHTKKVELCYLGLNLDEPATPIRYAINTLVNQFVRNSLVHGIETPDERRQRGKSESGHLSVYVSDQCDGTLELSFRDDGRGINIEKIRQSAIQSGRYSESEAAALNARQLTMLIFEPGLSTHNTVDEDAGRGVGLDAVKDLIARMGGRIRIGSTQGEYCHFRVVLPFTKAANIATKAADEIEEEREAA